MRTNSAKVRAPAHFDVAEEGSIEARSPAWLPSSDRPLYSDIVEESGVITRRDSRREGGSSLGRWALRAGVLLTILGVSPWLIYIAGLMAIMAFPLLPIAGFVFAAALGKGGEAPRAELPPTNVERRPRLGATSNHDLLRAA